MEIVIGQIVTYLANKIAGGESFQKFTEEFSEATINWIKPIFLKEDLKSKEILTDLEEDPTEELNKQAAILSISKALKKDPTLENKVNQLAEEINKLTGNRNSVSNTQNITGNDNVAIQGVSGAKIEINKSNNEK